jgi:hypothetical protein
MLSHLGVRKQRERRLAAVSRRIPTCPHIQRSPHERLQAVYREWFLTISASNRSSSVFAACSQPSDDMFGAFRLTNCGIHGVQRVNKSLPRSTYKRVSGHALRKVNGLSGARLRADRRFGLRRASGRAGLITRWRIGTAPGRNLGEVHYGCRIVILK